MVRTKAKLIAATSTNTKETFKTKNKFGREGCKRKKIRWRSSVGELRRRIAHYIKTSNFKLIKDPKKNVLSDASWEDSSKIRNLIHESLPRIKISKVMKVDNPYLAAMYELTKEEYSSRYGIRHVELMGKMFHATHPSNVDSIVEDNLDWRRVVRCRYGRGTSFSGIADYANCHANRGNGTNRAFIICKVLEYRHTRGTSSMLVPPEGFDTTTGDGEDKIARIICRRAVHVKYQDNEFLPIFVAYYECDMVRDVYGSGYN